MRLSTAQLVDTAVRLAELRFPATAVQVHRTRLAYIHLENLLHFSKIDRDGRIDGYIAAYLPDEVAVLLLERGELVTSVALTEAGREVLPIAVALGRIHDELERGELTFCEAPLQQLGWMVASCTQPIAKRPIQASEPWTLFKALQHEGFSGILELISNGRLSYLSFEGGEYKSGYFCGKDEHVSVSQFVEALLAPGSGGAVPALSACVFEPVGALPRQAPPAMIATYRTLFWRIADAAEQQVSGDAMTRAMTLRDSLGTVHEVLKAIGAAREGEPDPIVVDPQKLTFGLSDWTAQLLEQLEVVAPGVASDILRDATREHRYVLQKAGFYDRLPWSVTW